MNDRRRPATAGQSIHPHGRDAAKSGQTTKPRRKREPTQAHRRHVEQHPADAMSALRLSKLESGAA